MAGGTGKKIFQGRIGLGSKRHTDLSRDKGVTSCCGLIKVQRRLPSVGGQPLTSNAHSQAFMVGSKEIMARSKKTFYQIE